jgi:hypothetical protein
LLGLEIIGVFGSVPTQASAQLAFSVNHPSASRSSRAPDENEEKKLIEAPHDVTSTYSFSLQANVRLQEKFAVHLVFLDRLSSHCRLFIPAQARLRIIVFFFFAVQFLVLIFDFVFMHGAKQPKKKEEKSPERAIETLFTRIYCLGVRAEQSLARKDLFDNRAITFREGLRNARGKVLLFSKALTSHKERATN